MDKQDTVIACVITIAIASVLMFGIWSGYRIAQANNIKNKQVQLECIDSGGTYVTAANSCILPDASR
jgi:hypothetical protein